MKNFINIYGVQNKLLFYSIILLIVTLSMSIIAISIVTNNYVKRFAVEKYQDINSKLKLKLENSFQESDDLTKKYIINSNIQQTLLNKQLSAIEKMDIQRTLSYVNFKYMKNLLYIDNKGQIYNQRLHNFKYEDFLKSEIYKVLEQEYSKTKWIWTEDTLFGAEEKALFIIRYIRHMEFSLDPGVFILKMSDEYFENMITTAQIDKKVIYIFIDNKGDICYEYIPNGYDLTEQNRKEILSNYNNSNIKQIKRAIMFSDLETKSKFTVVTVVPNDIINSLIYKIQILILIIFLIVCFITIIASTFLSKIITRPIKQINDAMSSFDGTDFSKTLSINTSTELDTIGHSYNNMIKNIYNLMEEIKKREHELRNSELNSLMYQINPHFLYNTLDNIYMLARINKDKKIILMIESLSKLLRISLSKGKDEVTIKEELEHVQSYLNIQQIRNDELFIYNINCSEDILQIKIIKLILQPIVENCIKYGFQEIYEGGVININVHKEENNIIFKIINNGKTIEEEQLKKLNNIVYLNFEQIKNYFPQTTGGYGVGNVVSRLKLKYGENIAFYYYCENQIKTECIIKIPIQA